MHFEFTLKTGNSNVKWHQSSARAPGLGQKATATQLGHRPHHLRHVFPIPAVECLCQLLPVDVLSCLWHTQINTGKPLLLNSSKILTLTRTSTRYETTCSKRQRTDAQMRIRSLAIKRQSAGFRLHTFDALNWETSRELAQYGAERNTPFAFNCYFLRL
jgi:hypothetical protein